MVSLQARPHAEAPSSSILMASRFGPVVGSNFGRIANSNLRRDLTEKRLNFPGQHA